MAGQQFVEIEISQIRLQSILEGLRLILHCHHIGVVWEWRKGAKMFQTETLRIAG
jgi:hypothetical protein